MTGLDEKGWEIPDQTPVAIPVRIQRYERDHIREIIRQELSRQAEDDGFETWEDADDFDVGDDFDPYSPYEEEFDPSTGASLWDNQSPSADAPPDPPPPPPGGEGGPAPVDLKSEEK